LAATLLGAKTQWPQLIRIEKSTHEILGDKATARIQDGRCFPEDSHVTLHQYISQLDGAEPHGTGYTIHLVATAFHVNVNIFVQNLSGTVALYQEYGMAGLPSIQLPPWVKELEPARVNILKKGGVFYPIKEPGQKLTKKNKQFKRGNQKTLFEDNKKKLDVSACFTTKVLKKLAMEQLMLCNQNEGNKSVKDIINQGTHFPSVHKVNKALYHVTNQTLRPFGYTIYQLSKLILKRIPNPPMAALLYITVVVTDQVQGDGEDHKIEALCKEISRRSGGLAIYIPGVKDLNHAYDRLCRRFQLYDQPGGSATPKQLLQYIAAMNLMGLAQATKELSPNTTTVAPCRHLAEVQPFETLAFAGFVSKYEEHLTQTCNNLWDETLAFIQGEFTPDPSGREQGYKQLLTDSLDTAAEYGAGVEMAHSLFKLSYTKGVRDIKAPLPIFPAGFDNSASQEDRDHFLQLYGLETLAKKRNQAIDQEGDTYEESLSKDSNLFASQCLHGFMQGKSAMITTPYPIFPPPSVLMGPCSPIHL